MEQICECTEILLRTAEPRKQKQKRPQAPGPTVLQTCVKWCGVAVYYRNRLASSTSMGMARMVRSRNSTSSFQKFSGTSLLIAMAPTSVR